MAQSVEKVPAETRWAIATQALTGAVTAASKALRDALGQDKYNEVWGQIWAEQGKTAKQAFQTWKHDKSRRVQALNDCAEILKKHAEPLSDILTREQGKPLSDASTEIAFSVVWFQATASFDLKTHVIQDDEKALIEIRRKPLGVIGAIAPWNYPILLAVWKIAPALLADNTVVLKPSPYTPLTTLKMGEILRDVLAPRSA